jgi:hypothetical protein
MNQVTILNWAEETPAPEHLHEAHAATCVIPNPVAATAPFWAAAKRGVLLLPRLKSDGFVHPRILVERGVPAEQVEWVESSGSSRLVASTVVWRSGAPAFSPRTPYTVLLARLDEGVQLIGAIPGAHEDLALGQRLRLGFLQVAPGQILPTFITEDPAR